jgi:LEA14-like dessication related protein
MRAITVTLLFALLAGCSTLVPRLETPKLSVVNVEVTKTELWEQRMKVRLRVQNPNDRSLPVHGLTAKLEVAGEEFATGVTAASFEVPALGEAEFDMDMTAHMAGALLKLLGRKGDAVGDAIDYRVTGKLSLSKGFLRSIPFEEKGSFNLNR